MTGTERKRQWRALNPERSQTAERKRAKRRRSMSDGTYWRYEHSLTRLSQRMWYPKLGPGAHRLSRTARAKLIQAQSRESMAPALAKARALGVSEDLLRKVAGRRLYTA